MVTRSAINKFLSTKNLAIAGVSRNSKKFGNSSYKYLKSKGFNLFPVNPNAESIGGDKCYKSLDEIPEKIESLLIVLPPEKSNEVVKLACSLNIENIWLQQGAESEEAIKFCEDKGINIIYNQCILMFTEPAAFPHKVHRWINKVARKIPS
jgi:uncharacterized protein